MDISFHISAQLSLKNAWLPPIFFLDSDSPCQDLLFPLSHKPIKNIVVFVGKFLKKPEYPEMRRTYAQ